MSIITKIQTQAKNLNRCNLYLDGEFCCGMELFVVMQNKLKEGMEINASDLQALVFESEKEKIFAYAVDYICKYLPTQKQLVHKLTDKGCTKQIIDYVIEKCKTYGYIDDLKYAQSYVFQNRNVKGKQKIEQELILKGINRDLIQEALNDYDENNEGCLTLARRKALNKDIDDPKVYASLIRYLQYRGYEWDAIKKAIDAIKNEEKND